MRVQDIGLSGQDDPTVLERAAVLGRVLLTHDAATIPEFAFVRIGAGQAMPGVIIVRRILAVGTAIEDILLVDELMAPPEMDGQILYLPL